MSTTALALLLGLALPSTQGGEAKPPPYDQTVVVPLRVHVLTSKRIAMANAKLDDARVREALAHANAIWAKAGLVFALESVVREPAAQEARFSLANEANEGVVDNTNFQMLLPRASRATNGLNLYIFQKLWFNAVTVAEDAAVVMEEVQLQTVEGGASDHLARVIARSLGTTLGLPGHADGKNLFGSGTNGVDLNGTQAGLARKLALELPGASNAADLRKAAQAAEAKKDAALARTLWSTLAEVPGEGAAEARKRRDALKNADRKTP